MKEIDFLEVECQYWYNKYHALLKKSSSRRVYAASFDMAEQEIVFYTRPEWNDFIVSVRDVMRDEFENVDNVSDAEVLEAWNDEFFWNKV